MTTEQKICVITGPTHGIGRNAAKKLAKMPNLTIVFAARSQTKAQSVIDEIKKEIPSASLDFILMDLASFRSVREFVAEFQKRYSKLHLLILNAGCRESKHLITEDGFEKCFQTNHLAHFLLTNLLMDTLKQSSPSRIVIIGSSLHKGGAGTGPASDLKSSKEEWNEARQYAPMQCYKRSKLCNIMFMFAIARKLQNTGVTANAICPGFVPHTSLHRNDGLFAAFLNKFVFGVLPFTRSVDQGGDAIVLLATDASFATNSGKYLENLRDAIASTEARNEEKQEKLWTQSLEWVGLAK